MELTVYRIQWISSLFQISKRSTKHQEMLKALAIERQWQMGSRCFSPSQNAKAIVLLRIIIHITSSIGWFSMPILKQSTQNAKIPDAGDCRELTHIGAAFNKKQVVLNVDWLRARLTLKAPLLPFAELGKPSSVIIGQKLRAGEPGQMDRQTDATKHIISLLCGQ